MRWPRDLKKVPDAEWYSSVGAAWLKLLGTLPQTFGPGYPRYMQGKLPDEQLQTFLGSYAELKHDTLLYVKQNFAEQGDGDEGRATAGTQRFCGAEYGFLAGTPAPGGLYCGRVQEIRPV